MEDNKAALFLILIIVVCVVLFRGEPDIAGCLRQMAMTSAGM